MPFLSDTVGCQEYVKLAAEAGRTVKLATAEELDDLIYSGDLDGNAMISVPDGDSACYYQHGRDINKNSEKIGSTVRWRDEWYLLAIGPAGWRPELTGKEWWDTLPKKDEPNPAGWVCSRLTGPTRVTVSTLVFPDKELVYGIGIYPTRESFIFQIVDVQNGVPSLVIASLSAPPQPAGQGLRWIFLPDRQEALEYLFNDKRTRHTNYWACTCQVGRAQAYLNRQRGPLGEKDTRFEPGDYVCGHVDGSEPGSTTLAVVHEVDEHGRIIYVQRRDGEILGVKAAKWKKQLDKDGGTKNLEKLFAKQGEFKSGGSYMTKLNWINGKPSKKAKDGHSASSARVVPTDHEKRLERAMEVRRKVYLEQIAAGLTPEQAMGYAKMHFEDVMEGRVT